MVFVLPLVYVLMPIVKYDFKILYTTCYSGELNTKTSKSNYHLKFQTWTIQVLECVPLVCVSTDLANIHRINSKKVVDIICSALQHLMKLEV